MKPSASRLSDADPAARPRPVLPSGQHVICCRTQRPCNGPQTRRNASAARFRFSV
jgi:hypothetical protein